MDIFKLFAAATLVVAAPAAAVVIDFEAGPSGGQANGFSATGAPGVTFFSANGSGLSLGNFGSQGNGNSLAVFNDSNGNFLIVKIAGGATGVSLGFGNDDPSFTNASDLATLKLFNGVVNFATVTSALNRDDVYNQTIVTAAPTPRGRAAWLLYYVMVRASGTDPDDWMTPGAR